MIHVVRKDTGEIVEICGDGSDVSHWGVEYTVYNFAKRIEDRERFKYIDGILTEIAPPKSRAQKKRDEVDKWKTHWQYHDAIIRDVYRTISTSLCEARTSGFEYGFCGAIYDRSPFEVFFVNEYSNSMMYLSAAARSFHLNNPPWWKSLSVNLYQAFYGILVVCLSTGPHRDKVTITRTKNNKTTSRVAPFPKLLALSQRQGSIFSPNSLPQTYSLTLSSNELESIDKLRQSYRNQFNHFPNHSFGFNPSDLNIHFFNMLRPLASLCIDIIPSRNGRTKLYTVSCIQHIADQLLLKHIKAGSPDREFT